MPQPLDMLPPTTRFRLGRFMLHQPAIAAPYIASRPGFNGYRFRRDACLIIDGFPRSANTFAWYAAKQALNGFGEVRGHTHSTATLIAAARHHRPNILVVRDPDEAVASYVQMAQGATVRHAFDAYTSFHRRLLPHLDSLGVAHFPDVTADFGSVMQAVNRKFSTHLPAFDNSDESNAAVRDAIDGWNARRWGGQIREAGVARPSKHRLRASEVLCNLDTNEEVARARAQAIYQKVRATSL